ARDRVDHVGGDPLIVVVVARGLDGDRGFRVDIGRRGHGLRVVIRGGGLGVVDPRRRGVVGRRRRRVVDIAAGRDRVYLDHIGECGRGTRGSNGDREGSHLAVHGSLLQESVYPFGSRGGPKFDPTAER